MRLDRMAQLDATVDLVTVATTFLETGYDACTFKVSYDVLHCSLGDPDLYSDIAQHLVLTLVEAKQDMRMVREKRPVRVVFSSGGSRLFCLNSHVPKRVKRGSPIRAFLLVVVLVTAIQ